MPAQHDERLLHAVVHVDPGFAVEHFGGGEDPVADLARKRQIARLNRAKELRLQIGNHRAAAGK